MMTLVAGGLVLALPLSARASEPSRTAVVCVVLADGDTLDAARVRPASETVRRIPALTWRGRPLAETRSFMITEFGVLARIDDYPYIGGDSRIAFSFDLGWMKNISERAAVGFSGYALVSDPTARLGIRARYRRWLSQRTSIDISPGVLLSGEDSGIEYDPPGFALGATLNAGDLVALTVDAEYARNLDLVHDTPPLQWEKRTDVAWRAGAKLGSGLGLLGAASLVGLVLYIGLSGGFD